MVPASMPSPVKLLGIGMVPAPRPPAPTLYTHVSLHARPEVWWLGFDALICPDVML